MCPPLLRSFATLLVLCGASVVCFAAKDDSKPVLMSTTGASTWSDLEDLKKQADAGKPAALAAYGEMVLTGDQVPKDVAQGIALLERAAKGGESKAAFRLGKVYDDGELVPRDAAKAMEHYRAAALAGEPEAQYNLGALYISGRGVRRDYREGLAWLIVGTKNGAPGDGEKQVRDRFTATNRTQLIADAEAKAVEIQEKIAAHKAAAEQAKAVGATKK